jgi:hypothetical protein
LFPSDDAQAPARRNARTEAVGGALEYVPDYSARRALCQVRAATGASVELDLGVARGVFFSARGMTTGSNRPTLNNPDQARMNQVGSSADNC